MALRSVIDIDVNDAAFKSYQANFQKYQDLLAKTPDAWKKVTRKIDASKKSFQELVAAAAARQGYAKLVAEAEAVAARSAEQQSRSWRDMARSTRDVAGNIVNATRSLLRWASLTTVFTGLLGAGGLFGIDRLAISAASQRRSSSGLGVTPGEQSAFGLNYGRVVDTGSVLGGVNEALTDASKRGNLYRAGLNEGDLTGKDAAQVSVALIGKLKALADQTPRELLGNIVGSYGLTSLGINAEDLQRLKDRPAGEIAGYARDFNRDKGSLNLTPGQQTAWENFKVQLDRAGGQIEKTFITELTPLTGPLGDLSKAFTDLVKSLLGGEGGKSLIHDMAEGLKSFATFVNSGEFKDDVKEFVADIGKMARAVHAAIGWLPSPIAAPEEPKTEIDKLLPGIRDRADKRFRSYNRADPSEPTDDMGGLSRGGVTKPIERLNDLLDWFKNHLPSLGNDLVPLPMGFHGTTPGGGQVWDIAYRPGGSGQFGAGVAPSIGGPNTSDNAQIAHDYFRSHGWSEAQTSGLLANAQAESGFDPSRVNKVGGDAGLFQWRGSRARQFTAFFGHAPQRGTLQEQLWFAQWELTEGPERRVGDQLRQIDDPGRAGDFVTRAYERPDPNRIDIIAQQRASLAQRFNQGVRILIHNNTGGNAIVSASALSG